VKTFFTKKVVAEEKICKQSRTKTFRASLGKFRQKYFAPQKFACYTYVWWLVEQKSEPSWVGNFHCCYAEDRGFDCLFIWLGATQQARNQGGIWKFSKQCIAILTFAETQRIKMKFYILII